jgi:hypothetical protein
MKTVVVIISQSNEIFKPTLDVTVLGRTDFGP